MPIKSIEIICLPCPKCEALERKIMEAIRGLEFQYKIKLTFDFKKCTNLREMAKYSLNASQTPVVLINGSVEFAGRIDGQAIRPKLDSIHKGY
ncbi:MAG: thioredoxin family protein [Candidatus Omnitrophica bacterium]|nr:thioredoxin family protein [Candidatus Omnitrophota bacterium]